MTGMITRSCASARWTLASVWASIPWRGVDDEDRALAGLEAAADLVGEVDVAGRVDEVEAVASGRRAASYSRRTARALMVMPFSRSRSIESRTWVVIWPLVDRVRQLEQPVGQRRLAVVDVGDDAEVADALRRDHPAESSEEPTRCSAPRGRRVTGAAGPATGGSLSFEGGAAAVGPTAVMPLTVRYELKYVSWWMSVPSAS